MSQFHWSPTRSSRVAEGVGRTSTPTCSSLMAETGTLLPLALYARPSDVMQLALLHVFDVERGTAALRLGSSP